MQKVRGLQQPDEFHQSQGLRGSVSLGFRVGREGAEAEGPEV